MKVIGITSGNGDTKLSLNKAYVDAFTQEGLTPVVLPTLESGNNEFPSRSKSLRSHAMNMMLRLDALLISGGRDIHPMTYHDEFRGAVNPDLNRDKMEIELLKAAIDTGTPVMGICRGFQLIGNYYNLDHWQQSISESQEVHSGGQVGVEKRNEPLHIVKTFGPFCKYLRSKGVLTVDQSIIHINSWHHQGFSLLDSGKYIKTWTQAGEQERMRAIQDIEATSPAIKILAVTDALVEAFQHRELPILGVQWHPEEYGNTSMTIKYFVDKFVNKEEREDAPAGEESRAVPEAEEAK